MIKNTLKSAWSQGKPTVNGWLGMGSAFAAEIMAEQGYDSLTVDIQHGFLDYHDAKGMLQAIRASGVMPIARAPWLEPGIIMKILDAGCLGVICPMIEHAEDAARLVALTRYPPDGCRSFGPTRAAVSAGENYAAEANREILTLAMIETKLGFKNRDAICATEGLGGIYIGPADLTLGLTDGKSPPGFDPEQPELVEAIQEILASAKKHGIACGLHCGSPAYAARAVEWGMDMVTLSVDARLFAAATKDVLEQFKQCRDGKTPNTKSDTPASY